jgi:hypothetical protein
MKKTWHLDRRTFLFGAGVTCGLPFLEAMETKKIKVPKRLAFIYFANGACVPNYAKDSEDYQKNKKYIWFPEKAGRNYVHNLATEPLEEFRQEMSILGGLSHPKSRQLLGHITGDTWLTAGDLRGAYKNSISLDQVAAAQLGRDTRCPYFSFSADGGVGYPTRTSTLSYNSMGIAIPSEHNHRKIFERYFSPTTGGSTKARRKNIQEDQKIVDLVLESSRDLQRRLGAKDKQKMDQYLSTLDSVEKQLQKNEAWLSVPLKDVNMSHIDVKVDPKEGCENYIRTMMDLMALGFQLDLTRVMAFQLYREDGMGVGDLYTKYGAGLGKGHHRLSHGTKDKEWATFDKWMSQNFAYFLRQMKNTSDEHGTLLDNTQVLYGSSQAHTHNARNCPLILAGGKNMGLKHGSYERFTEKVPMSNLFVSMAQSAEVILPKNHQGQGRFSDSTGNLPSKIFS